MERRVAPWLTTRQYSLIWHQDSDKRLEHAWQWQQLSNGLLYTVLRCTGDAYEALVLFIFTQKTIDEQKGARTGFLWCHRHCLRWWLSCCLILNNTRCTPCLLTLANSLLKMHELSLVLYMTYASRWWRSSYPPPYSINCMGVRLPTLLRHCSLEGAIYSQGVH